MQAPTVETLATSPNLSDRELSLRFFDQDVRIRSDTGTYIDLFARMYPRFQIKEEMAPARSPVEFAIWTRPDNPWGKPVLVLNGEAWPLDDAVFGQGYVYDSILNSIVTEVRSHFLIHAGVVARNGQGVILAADSAHGKTTLVLELVRRGFQFLSDEMAALDRANRQITPFPRSLRIRPGTLSLAGFPDAGQGAPRWLGKLLLDIDEIKPNTMGPAAAISHIVILQDPASPTGPVPVGAARELTLLVNRLDERLLTTIRALEGVSDVRSDVERGYPAIRCQAAQRMSTLHQIEALCRAQGVLILDISKRPETQPTFDSPALLEPIARSQAVVELLRRFQGGHKSALLQSDFGGSSTRLFVELAKLIDQARCHQLFVGPLHQAADLICNLVK